MDAFLAQTSAEGVGRTGTALIGLAVMLGLVVLSIVCVVKAFTRRTTGWVIAGFLGGIVASLITITIVVGFTKGLRSAMERSGASAPQLDEAPAGSSRPPATELVRGRDMAYSIRVPVAWTTKTGEADFDTLNHFKSLYVGVIAEEADLGSPETIADLARSQITEVGTDIRWDEPEPLTLDGRSWLQFGVDCNVNKIAFTYEFYVYSGREGTYQIIGWTTRNLYERDASVLNDVMQSFRFPE